MSAYRDVRPIVLEKSHERPGIELVKGQPSPLVLPWFVHLIVQPSEHIRRLVHHVDVCPGVEVAEHFGSVFESIDMANLASCSKLDYRAFDGLGRPHMAGAG